MIKMKKIALSLAAALAMSVSAASAADVVYQEPAPAPFHSVYDWTGFYLGVNGGYVRTRATVPGFRENFTGGLLGVHAGANWQVDSWVYGIEGDLAYTWNEETLFGVAEAGTDWQGSVRARVGYAIDRTLIFGTAGFAATRAYVEVPGFFSESRTFTGWTAGAGVEHAFTDNWTGRVEYRYADYGRKDFAGIDVRLREHSARVGLSYKF